MNFTIVSVCISTVNTDGAIGQCYEIWPPTTDVSLGEAKEVLHNLGHTPV